MAISLTMGPQGGVPMVSEHTHAPVASARGLVPLACTGIDRLDGWRCRQPRDGEDA